MLEDGLVNLWKLLWQIHLKILEIESMLLCRLLDWGVTENVCMNGILDLEAR
jgi:hypothetical protein